MTIEGTHVRSQLAQATQPTPMTTFWRLLRRRAPLSIRFWCGSAIGSTSWPMIMMIGSGWQIYNARRCSRLRFPARSRSRLARGGRMLWHFRGDVAAGRERSRLYRARHRHGRFRRKSCRSGPATSSPTRRPRSRASSLTTICRLQRRAEAALSRGDPRRHRHRAGRASRSGSRCSCRRSPRLLGATTPRAMCTPGDGAIVDFWSSSGDVAAGAEESGTPWSPGVSYV